MNYYLRSVVLFMVCILSLYLSLYGSTLNIRLIPRPSTPILLTFNTVHDSSFVPRLYILSFSGERLSYFRKSVSTVHSTSDFVLFLGWCISCPLSHRPVSSHRRFRNSVLVSDYIWSLTPFSSLLLVSPCSTPTFSSVLSLVISTYLVPFLLTKIRSTAIPW